MIINHNIAALNTYRQLTSINNATGKSLEKLSSGSRINRAGDDAAGLAISEKMRAQIRGLDQAARNAQDSISMIQTAEGSLQETHSILQRMRELAVQAASDTNADADREEIQKEINELSSEINRIGNSTEFNTTNLLEGSLTGRDFAGSSTTTDATTGLTLSVNGSTLAVGEHKLAVTTDAEALSDPDDITVSGGLYSGTGGTDAVFSGSIIATSTSVGTDSWTLTYSKVDSGNTLTMTDSGSTNLTVAVDGSNALTAGSYTLMVSGVQQDHSDFTPTAADVSGTGTATFSGNIIASDNTLGNEEITITYELSGTDEYLHITTSGGGVDDWINATDAYNDHGISFKITDTTGLADGETFIYVFSGGGAEDAGTDRSVYSAGNAGGNDATFSGGDIYVDDTVAAGTWTIEFDGVSGFTVSNNLTGDAAVSGEWILSGSAYDAHGVSFNITNTGSMSGGDTLEFTTTPTYEWSLALSGADSGSTTISGVSGSYTFTDISGGDTGISGMLIDGNAITSGSYTFTIADTYTTGYTLTNSGATVNDAVTVGVAYNSNGLNFKLTDSGTMADGDEINFDTTAPTQTYTYTLSLDDATDTAVVSGVSGSSTFSANTDIGGLSIAGSGLSSGSFTFTVSNTSDSSTAATYQIGANENQSMSLNFGDMRALSLGVVSNYSGETGFTSTQVVTDGTNATEVQYGLDVTSASNASNAVTVIESAIQTVSAERSKLGAYQNRLEHTINNLGTAAQNLTAAESRIRDVDMAKEMMEFTKNNIISQAATAMLAQANQQPQQVLQLLR